MYGGIGGTGREMGAGYIDAEHWHSRDGRRAAGGNVDSACDSRDVHE